MNSGIYAIVHRETGRRYVGSSLHLRHRMGAHRRQLNRGIHPNTYLRRAWQKYGADAFDFIVIELVEPQRLAEREQSHLDACRPNVFNVGHDVTSPARGSKWTAAKHRQMRAALTGHVVTPETRAKIGAGNKVNRITPEQKEKLRVANLGKKASVETRAKMRAARLGKSLPPVPPERREKIRQTLLGRTLTPEHRANVSAAQRGRKHSAEWCANIAAGLRGKPLSDDHRAKLRAGWARRRERMALGGAI